MSSTRPCSTCPKATGHTHCIGCDQYYCTKCYRQHRQSLNTILTDIVNNRDMIQENLQRTLKDNCNVDKLLTDIHTWEKTMFELVSETARDCRKRLLEMVEIVRKDFPKRLSNMSENIKRWRETEDFMEMDLNRTKHQLRTLERDLKSFYESNEVVSIEDPSTRIDWLNLVKVRTRFGGLFELPKVPWNAKWSPNSVTVVNGLNEPFGIRIDQADGVVYIADQTNDRVVSWDPVTKEIRVVTTNVNYPSDLLVISETQSIIIADKGNRRVIRCSIEKSESRIETLVENISCFGLAMDQDGAVYVSDKEKHEVRRFKDGDKTGVVVAGGNGQGRGLNQLDNPRFLVIDDDGSLYVSDWNNHRVMKWKRGAKEGIVVAGTGKKGSGSDQLSIPNGIIVDQSGTLYVTEGERISRWRRGETVGETIVRGNGSGDGPNQIGPIGIAFDGKAKNGRTKISRTKIARRKLVERELVEI